MNRKGESLHAALLAAEQLLLRNDFVGARERYAEALAIAHFENGEASREFLAALSGLANATRENNVEPCPQLGSAIVIQERVVTIAGTALPAQDPQLAAYWNFLAVLRQSNRDSSGAEEAIRRALNVTPHQHDLLVTLLTLLLDANRFAEALPIARECAHLGEEEDGRMSIVDTFLLATCLQGLGLKKEAREQFEAILRNSPESSDEDRRALEETIRSLK